MTDIVWARRQSSLWEELIRLVQGAMDENLPCLVVVPQQYTLKCERDLIESLKLSGLLDINVLSPKRLYSRIREEAGAKEKIVIRRRRAGCPVLSCGKARTSAILTAGNPHARLLWMLLRKPSAFWIRALAKPIGS